MTETAKDVYLELDGCFKIKQNLILASHYLTIYPSNQRSKSLELEAGVLVVIEAKRNLFKPKESLKMSADILDEALQTFEKSQKICRQPVHFNLQGI